MCERHPVQLARFSETVRDARDASRTSAVLCTDLSIAWYVYPLRRSGVCPAPLHTVDVGLAVSRVIQGGVWVWVPSHTYTQ